jgi:hypothetical protein
MVALKVVEALVGLLTVRPFPLRRPHEYVYPGVPPVAVTVVAPLTTNDELAELAFPRTPVGEAMAVRTLLNTCLHTPPVRTQTDLRFTQAPPVRTAIFCSGCQVPPDLILMLGMVVTSR